MGKHFEDIKMEKQSNYKRDCNVVSGVIIQKE